MNLGIYKWPTLNRFASADTIVPDPGSPQSFNRYSYGYNNPVKYMDPSGHRSCSAEQAATGDETCNQNIPLPEGRYLESSYGGGIYFDKAHVAGGATMAEILINEMREAISNGGGQFTLSRRQTVPHTNLVAARYTATYWVSGNITDDQFVAVALAIYMDFEFGWETWQSSIPIGSGRESAFSIEDFSSDYVGFFATANDLSYTEVLMMLGPVRGTSEGNIPKSACVGPTCDDFSVKNWDFAGFTPKANVDGSWQNIPWPDQLQITPLNDPSLWRFMGDSTCIGTSSMCMNNETLYNFLFEN